MIPYIWIGFLFASLGLHELGHYVYARFFIKGERPKFKLDKFFNPSVYMKPDEKYYTEHPNEYFVSYLAFSFMGLLWGATFLLAFSPYLDQPIWLLLEFSVVVSIFDILNVPRAIYKYRWLRKKTHGRNQAISS